MAGEWLTGEDLLQDRYNGNKLKMFADIRSGKIVPRKYWSENFKTGTIQNGKIVPRYGEKHDGTSRIWPDSEEAKKIYEKVENLEELLFKLKASNEDILRQHYQRINHLPLFVFKAEAEKYEEKFKVYAESEEGKKMLAEFEGKRGDWEEEARKLKEQADKALPVLWRDVVFTPELQKKLLGAYYLVEFGNGAYHPELFTPGRDQEERHPAGTTNKVKTPIRKPGVKWGLTQSLENARALLIRKNKKEPSPKEVINFLKADDPLGIVTDWGTDDKGGYLKWVGNSGRSHETRYRTIANKISLIRKDNNKI